MRVSNVKAHGGRVGNFINNAVFHEPVNPALPLVTFIYLDEISVMGDIY